MKVEAWSRAQLVVFLIAAAFVGVFTYGAYAAWEARNDARAEWSSRTFRSYLDIWAMAKQMDDQEATQRAVESINRHQEQAFADSHVYIRRRAIFRPLAFAISMLGIPVLMLFVSWRWASAQQRDSPGGTSG